MPTPEHPGLSVRIWGARGTIPTPSAANLAHGGNTPCLQILTPTTPHTTIILDAGTGIHDLGHQLLASRPQAIHLFLTHFHSDHIHGLPTFAPLYEPTTSLTVHSTHPTTDLHHALHTQMSAPYFPVDMNSVPATVLLEQTTATTHIADLTIIPFALHHPGGATGYRITRSNPGELNSHTIVYATDHEPGNPAADARLLAAATHADILILDAQYTPETYPQRIGWGHGTCQQAAHLALQANVKQLVLFHHDPHHNDQTLKQILIQAQQIFPNTTSATEGTTLHTTGRFPIPNP